MKKSILAMFLIFTMVLLAACGGKIGPEETVNNFMKDMKKLEIAKSASYLNDELAEEFEGMVSEQSEIVDDEFTFEDFKKLKEYPKFEGEFKKLASKLDHKIIKAATDEMSATIELEVTYADASEPLAESMKEAFIQLMGLMFSEPTDNEPDNNKIVGKMLSTVTSNLEYAKAETKKTTGKIELVKVNDEWLISDFSDEIKNALLFGAIDGMESIDLMSN